MFGCCCFAAGNIMMISVALWSSSIEIMGIGTRDLMHWLSGLIALPCVFIQVSRSFVRLGLCYVLAKLIWMCRFLWVWLVLFWWVCGWVSHHGGDAYFDSAVMLLFLLIGRYLDFRARRKARGQHPIYWRWWQGRRLLYKRMVVKICSYSRFKRGNGSSGSYGGSVFLLIPKWLPVCRILIRHLWRETMPEWSGSGMLFMRERPIFHAPWIWY